LPQPEASASFTERTLSKLEPIRHPARKKKSAAVGRGAVLLRWLALGSGWAAAVLLAAFVGYQAVRGGSPGGPGEAEMLRDLRVIEHKARYDLVDDLDFLRRLDQPDLFGEDGRGG